MPEESVRAAIEAFLAVKRFAFVGVSRQAMDFSRAVFAEFVKRGYDVVPVNPNAALIEDLRCYPVIEEVQPPVEAAFLMLPAASLSRAVERCASAGVRRLWIHRGAGRGAQTQAAVDLAGKHGMVVVAGECPLMWLPNALWIHRAHRALRQITGTLPR